MQSTLAMPSATELLPLIPELVLVGAAFALLLLDLFLDEKRRVVTHLLAVASLVTVFQRMLTVRAQALASKG